MIGNKAMKIVLSILISLFTVICFSACAGDSRAVEPDAAGSDTGLSESEYDAEAGADKSYEDILRGHYLRGHMWDYTDLGSGASNDDPYFERYWTVAYDPLTKECTDVAEEEYFELDMGEGGYDYSEVEARKRQLEEVFADMDFVDVEIDNEGDGSFSRVVTLYHDMDDSANRIELANKGILCMQTGWCTTIDEAMETILSLHGEMEGVNVLSEEDACVYARYVALDRGYITPDTDVIIECDDVTADGYTIHAYELVADEVAEHTATYFWWTVTEDQAITDMVTGEHII